MPNDTYDEGSLNDPQVWKKSGNEFFNKGQYEDAIKCYNHAIELNPNFIDAWNNLGLALLKLGKIDEAKQCNEKVKLIKEKMKTQPSPASTAKNNNNPEKDTKIDDDIITANQKSIIEKKVQETGVCSNCGKQLPYRKGEWPRGVPRYCQNCGYRINDTKNIGVTPEYKNPKIAALLSVLPGLGQVYNGAIIRGLLFLFGTILGLFLVIPGIIIWIYGIYDAYKYTKKVNDGELLPKKGKKFFIAIFGVISFALLILVLSYFAFSLTPEYTVQQYVGAWNDHNSEKVYDLLSSKAKQETSKNTVHNDMGYALQVVDYWITSKNENSGTAQITIAMTLDTASSPYTTQSMRFTRQKTFDLVRENGQWRINKYSMLI